MSKILSQKEIDALLSTVDTDKQSGSIKKQILDSLEVANNNEEISHTAYNWLKSLTKSLPDKQIDLDAVVEKSIKAVYETIAYVNNHQCRKKCKHETYKDFEEDCKIQAFDKVKQILLEAGIK